MGVVTWHARALDKTDFETFPFCKWLPFLSFSVFIFQIFHQQHLPPPEFSDYLSSQISVIFIWFENFVRGFWIRKGAGGGRQEEEEEESGTPGLTELEEPINGIQTVFSFFFSASKMFCFNSNLFRSNLSLSSLCVGVCLCVLPFARTVHSLMLLFTIITVLWLTDYTVLV